MISIRIIKIVVVPNKKVLVSMIIMIFLTITHQGTIVMKT